MELFLGLFVGVGVFAFVTVYGIGFVDGGRMFLKRDRGSSQGSRELAVSSAPAFTPLELSDAGMKWPSEMKLVRKPFPTLPWPSETWTGDFFGRKGGLGTGSYASAGATGGGAGSAPVPAAEHNETEDSFFGDAPKAPPVRQQQQKQAQQKPAKSAPAKSNKQAPARPPPAAASSGLPSDDEIIALVEKQGLAAAVERVRGASGWEFQKAAAHIAQVLRNRRGRA